MSDLRAALERIRDHGYQPMYNGRPSCPFCGNFVDDEQTHAPGCVLLALAATEAPAAVAEQITAVTRAAYEKHGFGAAVAVPLDATERAAAKERHDRNDDYGYTMSVLDPERLARALEQADCGPEGEHHTPDFARRVAAAYRDAKP